jgi:hypothetical protein
MRTCVRSILTMVILAGCGSQQSVPLDPQIIVTPTSILFDSDQGGSWFVGSTVPSGTVITNGGQNPLTITAVTLTGDSAFSVVMPTPGAPDCDAGTTCQKLTVDRYPDTAVVTLLFTPTNTKTYKATLTITSNGANDGGTVVIPVVAIGVNRADAGMSDGG